MIGNSRDTVKKSIFCFVLFLLVLFVEFGLLIVTAIALMPAGRAVACCPRPTRAPTAWAVVQLLSYRKSTRCSTKAAAGTVIRRADDEEVVVALGTVTSPIAPVLRRGRAVGYLLTLSAQWLVAAVAGEVPILWSVATVSTGLHHWLVGRAVQIIIVVADVAAVLVVELAATRVLIVRRVVRLAEL